MNESILMSSLSGKRDLYLDYKIGPEDLLEISMFEAEELNRTVRVSFQGNISLPLLGTLKVKGLTASELEREIRALLAEKYLQDPHVSVFIREYRSHRISVMGAVEKPNVYGVTGQKRILDMLAMAGGLTDNAGYLLFLIRPPGANEGEAQNPKAESDRGEAKTYVIDLKELLIGGNLALNLAVMHGDVINVPVGGKVFVGGEVWRPGGFPLKGERMTVNQAIVLAGGVKPQADGSKTRIFRSTAKGTGRDIIPIDVYAIQKGQEEDVFLSENDIVIVPRHGAKAFLIGIRDTFAGVFTLGYALGTY
jgi:polysaccharide export outer membrane protein